jgi:8-oxo-dGTP diphosphatase
MKTLINTTLCYIEKDNSYLMLHRTKKEHDYNKDKWIGIGGKFENGESPEDCAVREVLEETGLVIKPEDLEYCGIVTFVDVSKVGEVSPSLQPVSQSFATPSAGSNAARNACFSPEAYTEFMHIFRARKFSGALKTDCDEGELEWVPLTKLKDLPHWQADEIFYDFLEQNHPFYSLKAVYKNNKLIETYLNGKEYNHWKI